MATNLTDTMKKALGRLARDEMVNAGVGTLRALESRGLITQNTEPHNGSGWRNLHMLTAAGWDTVKADVDVCERTENTTTVQDAKTVLNFDNHGSYWGESTVADTEADIEQAKTSGQRIDEWHETDRVGRPLRIVRIADPDFLDTICVIPLGVGECPNCGAPLSSTAAPLDEHHPKCPRRDPRF